MSRPTIIGRPFANFTHRVVGKMNIKILPVCSMGYQPFSWYQGPSRQLRKSNFCSSSILTHGVYLVYWIAPCPKSLLFCWSLSYLAHGKIWYVYCSWDSLFDHQVYTYDISQHNYHASGLWAHIVLGYTFTFDFYTCNYNILQLITCLFTYLFTFSRSCRFP